VPVKNSIYLSSCPKSRSARVLPPLRGFVVVEVQEYAESLPALHGPVREDSLVSDEQRVAESLMRALSVVVLKILEG
jgi:hypothetical protein